ncbi:bifunctional NUDIX hydrolase/phosphatase PAP2 family protein [Vibrio ostreicida]|uniref:Bifunctional NUDIX hydrolase/phosphatase PAP2 family protein n=1 Tax=Vibrio ostreicida TaxID=526588 RepID=A0ABT8BVI1_9VIBR|nr:bifunctional NUDIX hydrolase/phosphatase PAP2 family protein [Vibrio ostreicida]MDN3610103.1 bifunctional NUDIX hydrolase/phosphatase PAP2 family protein [Vibrio ostreicida]NPD07872.1 NUDIX domain-containing protein [Vibrio ostreicida]
MNTLEPFIRLLSLVTFLFFSSFIFADQTQRVKVLGAACLIKADDKLVLVDEILTGKLWLPAGSLDIGEEPETAAQRETWEETGLTVSVKKELGQIGNTLFFDCVSDSTLVVFNIDDSFDAHQVPVWFAPHYGAEIASAILVEPKNIDPQNYRFPNDLSLMLDLFYKATPQSVKYVDNLVTAAPVFNQIELSWLYELRLLLDTLPPLVEARFETLLDLSLALIDPLALLVLFPYLYWRFGRDFTYSAYFSVILTSVMVLLAKQGFQMPSPHVYMASTPVIKSFGYSFPSLSFAILVCVMTLLSTKQRGVSTALFLTIGGGILLWLALANFYTGRHFMADMVFGALAGSLCAWHLIRLNNKSDVKLLALIQSRRTWGLMLFVSGLMIMSWPIPPMANLCTIVLTSLMTAHSIAGKCQSISRHGFIVISCILLAIYGLFDLTLSFVSESSILSFAIEVFRYPVLIYVFVLSVDNPPKNVARYVDFGGN